MFLARFLCCLWKYQWRNNVLASGFQTKELEKLHLEFWIHQICYATSSGGCLPLLWYAFMNEYSYVWVYLHSSYHPGCCETAATCHFAQAEAVITALSLRTWCSLQQVDDPAWSHQRLSMFCLIHRGKSSSVSRPAFRLRGGRMFPAKFPACYQQEGSSRTFGLRINTEQCLHGTPQLAQVQLVFIVKT